jgi:hypothetical protein
MRVPDIRPSSYAAARPAITGSFRKPILGQLASGPSSQEIADADVEAI